MDDLKEDEVFKIIPDFPAYRISNFGKLQTRWQKGKGNNRQNYLSDKWKDRCVGKTSKGYYIIPLYKGKNTTPKMFLIHRLVAMMFLDKPTTKERLCVRHLDGNIINNCVNNLAWGTYSDNEQDKKKHGTYFNKHKFLNHEHAKISEEQVIKIRELANQNISHQQLAKKYGLSLSGIGKIIHGKCWKFLPILYKRRRKYAKLDQKTKKTSKKR